MFREPSQRLISAFHHARHAVGADAETAAQLAAMRDGGGGGGNGGGDSGDRGDGGDGGDSGDGGRGGPRGPSPLSSAAQFVRVRGIAGCQAKMLNHGCLAVTLECFKRDHQILMCATRHLDRRRCSRATPAPPPLPRWTSRPRSRRSSSCASSGSSSDGARR
jgi:hypothetical protein